jgi:hypothetical protein
MITLKIIGIFLLIIIFLGILLMSVLCDKSGRHMPGDPDRGGWRKIEKDKRNGGGR